MEPFVLAQEMFPEQVTTNRSAEPGLRVRRRGRPLVVVGLVMLDAASVRRPNVFNSTIEKIVGFFIGFTPTS